MEIIISIIALIIAISGWIVTYIFTIKAQNKNFMNQVVNDARLRITKDIREYQNWLGKVDTKINALSFSIIVEEQGRHVDWQDQTAKLREIFFSDKAVSKWILSLEEHEILFPETAGCRMDLLDRQREIQRYLGLFLEKLQCVSVIPGAAEERKRCIEQAKSKSELLYDQLALMEDLRIYLQNRCLRSFTGNKIPERKPEDMSLPRLVQNKSGMLEISTSQN
jgi:hypothetical protein